MTGSLAVNSETHCESMAAEKYVLGEMAGEERDRFEEHYFTCAECAESVRLLSHLQHAVRAMPLAGFDASAASLAARPSTARKVSPKLQKWWRGPQWALGVSALALAAITGYQNWQMRNLLQPQVLRSVALQPATRGELPVVQTRSGEPFVLLEADLPGASGGLAWTLRTARGQAVLNGKGAAPEPGLLFRILVPSSALSETEYTLSVQSQAEQEWLFRFRTGEN